VEKNQCQARSRWMPASPCGDGRPVKAAAAQNLARVEAACTREFLRGGVARAADDGCRGSAECAGTACARGMAGDGEGGGARAADATSTG
jgi:hypothetical protein